MDRIECPDCGEDVGEDEIEENDMCCPFCGYEFDEEELD